MPARGPVTKNLEEERHKIATLRHMCEDPGGSTAGASLYLVPRSLGAACFCSPNVTQFELLASLPLAAH